MVNERDHQQKTSFHVHLASFARTPSSYKFPWTPARANSFSGSLPQFLTGRGQALASGVVFGKGVAVGFSRADIYPTLYPTRKKWIFLTETNLGVVQALLPERDTRWLQQTCSLWIHFHKELTRKISFMIDLDHPVCKPKKIPWCLTYCRNPMGAGNQNPQERQQPTPPFSHGSPPPPPAPCAHFLN